MGGKGLNLLERTMGVIAPRMATRHFYARMGLQAAGKVSQRFGLGSGYDGGTIDSRTKGWYAPNTDAVGASEGQLELLRARSRDLVRNNPYASRAVNVVVDHAVGTGIRPQAQAPTALSTSIEAEWRAWAEATTCDADGCHDFYGLQAAAMRCIAESGSVLIRRRIRKPEDAKGLPSPLQLQLMEPDHLDLSKREGRSTNKVVQGVEYDGIGRRVAYWLFRDHPGGQLTGTGSGLSESRRVPASEILHVFRRDRPGQVQGVPWAAAAILMLKGLDEYMDAELVRKRLAACFTAFVMGSGGGPTATVAGEKPSESLEPGLITYLKDGEAVEFAAPPDSGGYGEYVTQVLRAVAIGFDVPYATLTGDLTKVNFSSGRMGGNDFGRTVGGWQAHILIPQMLDPIWAWWVEAAMATATLRERVTATWTAPGRVQVDPAKEGKADHEAVRNGTKTLFQVLRERGRDPEEHLREIVRSNEMLDELGLKLDSDPRNSAAPGSPGKAGGDSDDDEDLDDEKDGSEDDKDDDES